MNKVDNYYPSNIDGLTIVNAITRKQYDGMIVGSRNERKLFRVIDSTGNYDNMGKYVRGTNNKNKLFFDNKEEYINFRLNKY